MPPMPRSAVRLITSTGKWCSASHSRACGAISVSANSRTIPETVCCSSVRPKGRAAAVLRDMVPPVIGRELGDRLHNTSRILGRPTKFCGNGPEADRMEAIPGSAAVFESGAQAFEVGQEGAEIGFGEVGCGEDRGGAGGRGLGRELTPCLGEVAASGSAGARSAAPGAGAGLDAAEGRRGAGRRS